MTIHFSRCKRFQLMAWFWNVFIKFYLHGEIFILALSELELLGSPVFEQSWKALAPSACDVWIYWHQSAATEEFQPDSTNEICHDNDVCRISQTKEIEISSSSHIYKKSDTKNILLYSFHLSYLLCFITFYKLFSHFVQMTWR